LAAILLVVPASFATAAENTTENADDPWRLCMDAVADAERAHNIPRHLMAAIAVAESGRWVRERQAKSAWPWTVMAEGKGRYLPTKAEAIATVRALKARNVRNIDVGCMQINLRHHPAAFTNLEQAFDPVANVAYSSTYLKTLYEETGSWQKASGRYHSATPKFNRPYRLRVLKLWNEQTRLAYEARRADRKRQTAARRAARASMPTTTPMPMPTRGNTANVAFSTNLVRCPPGASSRHACRAPAYVGRRAHPSGG
jgi:hypothetical protein